MEFIEGKSLEELVGGQWGQRRPLSNFVSKLINPAKVEMIVKKSFKLCLLITLLFAVASGFSQEAQTDSARVERPKFSMTPT